MPELTWSSETDWNNAQSSSNVAIDGGSFSLTSAIPDSGVSRWTLDNGDTDNGTALDTWGNLDATINGATTGASGANQTYTTNEAYSFDGTDDVLTGPTDSVGIADGTIHDFTIAAWCYWDGSTYTIQGIYNAPHVSGGAPGNPSYGLSLGGSTNNHPIVYIQNDNNNFFSAEYSVSFPSNTWTHLCGVYRGGTLNIYQNGAIVSTNTVNEAIFDLSTVNQDIGHLIGAQKESDNRYWTGRLDDVRLYDKGLTDTEVSNLYNSGSISG